MAPWASSDMRISFSTKSRSSVFSRSIMRFTRILKGAHTRTDTTWGTGRSRWVAPQPRITATFPLSASPKVSSAV